MMESYLRITFLDFELGPAETFYIKTDKAGFIANSFVHIRDEHGVIDDSYIIRHDLLDEKMLRYLEFEPSVVGVYRNYTGDSEVFADDLIDAIYDMKENVDFSREHLWNVLNDFHDSCKSIL